MVMQEADVCFCKRDIMSVCTADKDSKQKKCSFYEKSCRTERCMYFVFDKYCDSLKAQMHAKQ